MDLKKALQILIIVVGVMFFLSRTSLIIELYDQVKLMVDRASGEKYAYMEDRVKDIITVINAEDRNALKAMFSEYVLENSVVIDEDIDTVFEYFRSDIFGHKGMFRDAKTSEDKSEKWFVGKFEVEDYYGKYILFFIDQVESAENTDNVGLRFLQICHRNDKSVTFPEYLGATGVVVVEP
jgi:hypothetical protein